MIGGTNAASAQTFVVLPDTSLVTAAAAKVNESARISGPAAVSFPVTDVRTSTQSAAVTVSIDQIVLDTTTKQLRISLKAGATSFTPPKAGATTWSSGDVTWNAALWTAATGSSGTLASNAYTAVASCNANASACSTTVLRFTLAPKPAVKRSGAHTMIVTWKLESIGS